jgi:uncharacterized damage-inducible protein DinB
MKQLLLSYATYNKWANAQLIILLEKLNPEQIVQTVHGSFTTIQESIYHLWMAESIWNQRLAMADKTIVPYENYTGTFTEALQAWQLESVNTIAFIKKQHSDDAFAHQVSYTRQKNEHFKSTVADILLHMHNHATFHRGQLIAQLREVGISKLPSTDFIAYARLVDAGKKV